MSWAEQSLDWQRARDRYFVSEFAFRSSLLEQINALAPPRVDTRSPEQQMFDDLDYQHAQVREAFSVLRGEASVSDYD
jgi:hypothetical protein